MRRTGALPLADLIGSTIAESCARRGLASVEIVTHWAEIVGDALAERAVPIRLAWPQRPESGEPGVLHVRVEGAYAIELQHEAPLVIERVNRYFGWRCVARLALRQGPVAGAVRRPRPPAEPDAQALAIAAARLGTFEDAALKASLARLGALVRRDIGARRAQDAPRPITQR